MIQTFAMIMNIQKMKQLSSIHTRLKTNKTPTLKCSSPLLMLKMKILNTQSDY